MPTCKPDGEDPELLQRVAELVEASPALRYATIQAARLSGVLGFTSAIVIIFRRAPLAWTLSFQPVITGIFVCFLGCLIIVVQQRERWAVTTWRIQHPEGNYGAG